MLAFQAPVIRGGDDQRNKKGSTSANNTIHNGSEVVDEARVTWNVGEAVWIRYNNLALIMNFLRRSHRKGGKPLV